MRRGWDGSQGTEQIEHGKGCLLATDMLMWTLLLGNTVGHTVAFDIRTESIRVERMNATVRTDGWISLDSLSSHFLTIDSRLCSEPVRHQDSCWRACLPAILSGCCQSSLLQFCQDQCTTMPADGSHGTLLKTDTVWIKQVQVSDWTTERPQPFCCWPKLLAVGQSRVKIDSPSNQEPPASFAVANSIQWQSWWWNSVWVSPVCSPSKPLCSG